jgi:hypothetical protein
MRTFATLPLLLALVGCRSTSVDEVGILAPDYDGPPIEVLATDVVGEDCVSAFSLLAQPSYGKAVADAVAKVEGATVMRNASFQYQDRVFELCTRVKGDVGRLP